MSFCSLSMSIMVLVFAFTSFFFSSSCALSTLAMTKVVSLLSSFFNDDAFRG